MPWHPSSEGVGDEHVPTYKGIFRMARGIIELIISTYMYTHICILFDRLRARLERLSILSLYHIYILGM